MRFWGSLFRSNPRADFGSILRGLLPLGRCFRYSRVVWKQRSAAFSSRLRPMSNALLPVQADVAALLADFLGPDGFGPSTASRPALRISSENSPLPAIRAITRVPIMVASAATACFRAALGDAP